MNEDREPEQTPPPGAPDFEAPPSGPAKPASNAGPPDSPQPPTQADRWNGQPSGGPQAGQPADPWRTGTSGGWYVPHEPSARARAQGESTEGAREPVTPRSATRSQRPRSEHWFQQPAPPRRRNPPHTRSARTSGSLACTYTIIAVCVLVWLGELFVPGVAADVALTPSLGLSQPWRLITSAFAHSPYSILHILTNMLMLWVMGRSLEPYLGRRDYVICYLLSALGGSAVFVLVAGLTSSNAAVVGASGAVFGLFGTQLAVSRHERLDNTGIWLLVGINLAFGFIVPGIAWQAHLGGFLTGLAAGWLVLRGRSGHASGWMYPLLLLVPIAAILVISAVLFG